MNAHVEYLGFKAREATREYALRVRVAGIDDRDFTIVIQNEAFLAHRVRYQDAPEICFLKLQRALTACAEGAEPARRLKVTEADLQDYREAQGPKPRLHALKRIGPPS
jgi:hypothetical protein